MGEKFLDESIWNTTTTFKKTMFFDPVLASYIFYCGGAVYAASR